MSEKAQSCPKCGAPNPNAAPVQQFSYQPQVNFNPCARHPQAPAVAQCGNCSSFLCKDCKDISVYTIENKPMCVDCNLAYMESNIAHLKSRKRWSLVKFIVLAILLSFAWFIYKDRPEDTNHIIGAWLVAALGGIFSTMSMIGRSDSEKFADELYSKVNPGDGLMNEGMGCLARIFCAVLFAPLFAAGYTVKHFFRWISSTSKLSKAKKEYAQYTAMLRERGDL